MVDLHTILAEHRSKKRSDGSIDIARVSSDVDANDVSNSSIPDIFFDYILVEFKLNRVDIMVIMYLYRFVWCRPNLYKVYGISQILSYTEMSKSLHLSLDEIYISLRKLEGYGFISTVRSGQYFVRKFFSKELDEQFVQTYDDFEI